VAVWALEKITGEKLDGEYAAEKAGRWIEWYRANKDEFK